MNARSWFIDFYSTWYISLPLGFNGLRISVRRNILWIFISRYTNKLNVLWQMVLPHAACSRRHSLVPSAVLLSCMCSDWFPIQEYLGTVVKYLNFFILLELGHRWLHSMYLQVEEVILWVCWAAGLSPPFPILLVVEWIRLRFSRLRITQGAWDVIY